MADDAPPIGTIGWFDLTVEDADSIRDFYAEVVGWTASDVDMGEYCDYNMAPSGSEPIGGVCHARGSNRDIPPFWIMYVMVSDLDSSMDACKRGGGEVVSGPHSMGDAGRYCIIKDPAGAPIGLFQS